MNRSRISQTKERMAASLAALAALASLAAWAVATAEPCRADAGDGGADAGQVQPAGPQLRESAFTLLWAEQAESAIRDFQRYFLTVPAAQDRQGRLGLALAYSWAGRQDDAAAVYRELLALDPNDGEAGVGLGRTLIWDNELRSGYRQLRAVRDRDPGSPAAREGAAFMLTVLDEYTPVLQGRWEASWDSDDLDITRFAVAAGLAGPGPVQIEVQPQVTRYTQPDREAIVAHRLGVAAAGTLRRNLSLHLGGWVDAFNRPGFLGGTRYWTRPGTDSWLTWLPSGRVRLDAGATSQPVESFAALTGKIGYVQGHLSGDWRAGRRWSLSLAGKAARYGDDNDRRQVSARLSWRRDGAVQVWVGPAATYLEFDHDAQGAYWSPARVRNMSLETTVKARSGPLTFRLNGSLGAEKDGQAATVTVGGASLRLGWQVGQGWLVAAEAGHARSALSTASGYRRTFTGLSVRAVF